MPVSIGTSIIVWIVKLIMITDSEANYNYNVMIMTLYCIDRYIIDKLTRRIDIHNIIKPQLA